LKDLEKERGHIQIVIRPVEGRSGEYVAYYETEFLQATFSVHLPIRAYSP